MEFEASGSGSVVHDDGSTVPLPRQARRLLVFVLTRSRRSASIEEIIDGLWGESPPRTARETVHVLVSRIRKAVGASAVERIPSGYRITLALDLDRFLAAFETAERLRRIDPAAALAVVADALTRSGGAIFGEFANEPWLSASVNMFLERRRTAEELWSGLQLEIGAAAEVIHHLEDAAAREPLREIRWEHLVTALYRAERQSDALGAYDRARRHLRESLGLEPGPALRAVYRAVLDHSMGPTAFASVLATISTRGDAFIGRSGELVEVDRLLDSGRLVTVVGLGGMGKSRLVGETCHRWLSAGHRVQRTAVLRGMDEEALARSLVMAGSRRSADTDVTAVIQCVELARETDLLIIDAAEHSIEAVRQLASHLLSAAPTVRLLVTSRVPIGLGAESMLTLNALSLDGGPDSDAYRLFADRLGVEVDDLGDGSRREFGLMVAKTAGIPMLVEMAAATFDPLKASVSAEPSGRRTAARADPVMDAIGEALDLVEPAARELVDALAVLPAGMSTMAIERWVGDATVARRLLWQLRTVRLVTTRISTGGARYRVLDPVGEGLVKALAESDLQRIGERAIAVFGALYHQLRPEEGEAVNTGCLGVLDDEHENLLYLLDGAIDAGDAETALMLARDATAYWWYRGVITPSRDRVRAAIALGTASTRATCEGLCSLTEVASDLFLVVALHGEWERAQLAMESEAVPVRLAAKVTIWAGLARGLNGDLDGWDQLMEVAEPMTDGDPWMRLQLDQVRAMRAVPNGDPDLARSVLRSCAARAVELGDPFSAVMALRLAAMVADLVGAVDTMVDVDAARSLAVNCGWDRMLPRLLGIEVSVLCRDPGLEDLDALERATRQVERSGVLRQGAVARRNVGLIRLHRDDRLGAWDDLLLAARRLLEGESSGGGVALVALGGLCADAAIARALIHTGRAWRSGNVIPETMGDRQRWDLVEELVARIRPAVRPGPALSLDRISQLLNDPSCAPAP